MNKWYTQDSKKIIEELSSSLEGISNKEVEKRLTKYGKNELPKQKKDGS